MSSAIITRQLSRRFGNNTAVDALDLDIPKGRVFGFLGPNGCGKSTLIRMLCGLLRPSAGEVEVLGLNIPQQAEALKLKTGYMTQTFSLYRDLSVDENLNFIADIYALTHKEKRLRLSELKERYNLNEIGKQISGSLSGGQRQRLALAASVIHKPELLFLDEPTSAVDPQSRRDFWESLFELIDLGTTILLSTHFMDEAERCHNLVILDHGRKMIEGAPKDLMKNLDATVVELKTEKIARARKILANHPKILGITQLGLSLRVLVSRQEKQPDILVQHQLQQHHCDAQALRVNANLEDVFVVATRHQAGTKT